MYNSFAEELVAIQGHEKEAIIQDIKAAWQGLKGIKNVGLRNTAQLAKVDAAKSAISAGKKVQGVRNAANTAIIKAHANPHVYNANIMARKYIDASNMTGSPFVTDYIQMGAEHLPYLRETASGAVSASKALAGRARGAMSRIPRPAFSTRPMSGPPALPVGA